MFVISRDVLFKTLDQLKRAINPKALLALKDYVHLVAADGGTSLTVQAKNDIWSLQMTVPDATIVTAIDIMIPFKYLLAVLKKMPVNLPVLMTYNEETKLLRIESQTIKNGRERVLEMTVECLPGDAWTGMYTPVDGAVQVDLPYSVLLTEYPKVIHCAAIVDNRPILEGVYIKLKNHDHQTSQLTMACADGYRLAIKTSMIPMVNHELVFVFHGDMWREWLKLHESRLKKNSSGVFRVDVPVNRQDDKTIEYGSFRTEDDSIVMSWQYLKGRFPDFEAIIPTERAFTVSVDSAELYDAVDTCLIYGSEDAYSIHLASGRTAGQIVVTSSKPGGKAKITDKVPADIWVDTAAPDDFFVFMDGRFLIDTLKRMTGNVILTSKMPANENPWVVTPVSDNDYLIIIMPMTKDT